MLNSLKYLLFFFILANSNKTFFKNYYFTMFIITHKDFKQNITGNFFKIVTDDATTLKLNYKIGLIYSKDNNPLYPKKISYGEISKMYYIWKNYRPLPKYVGFNHYRRYFRLGDNTPDLDVIFKNYDVILNNAANMRSLTIMQQFKKFHTEYALDEAIEIIKNIKPEYYETALKTMNSSIVYFCNLFVMKSEDFLKWGEFVFPILFEYDKRHNLNNDSDVEKYILKEWGKYEKKKLNINYQRRLGGFLAERLSNIFYNHHFKNKYEVNVLEYDKIPLTTEPNERQKDIVIICFLFISLSILFVLYCINIKIKSKKRNNNKNKEFKRSFNNAPIINEELQTLETEKIDL